MSLDFCGVEVDAVGAGWAMVGRMVSGFWGVRKGRLGRGCLMGVGGASEGGYHWERDGRGGRDGN